MCGAQQLQCKSESAPQIIGAHQPHQACNEYTVLKAQSQQGGKGGTVFLISESGRGEGAQLLASRPEYMGFAM